jgi:N-acetyl-gamma-glutamyl-phosphate reductase
MSSKINVAVVGASGYSGEELLRLLYRHPNCSIKVITSRQYDKQHVSEVFPRFANCDLYFSAPNVEQIAKTCDVAFLALPHGLAAEFAKPLLEKGVSVIDISADFRLRSLDKYKSYYGEHPAPELLDLAVYGMPERNRDKIKEATLIACPGCYPTSIILPTSAILAAGIAKSTNIVVSSMSGVSGAGRKVDLPFIFPECNESVRGYGVTGHRHLPEIEQELAIAAGVDSVAMNFIPHLVPVNRGINSTIILDAARETTTEEICQVLADTYKNDEFVVTLPPGKLPDTKHVTRTNNCEVGGVYDSHTNKIILLSCIDNLTKGASGQAIQAMNIRFGFPENAGLLL